jgi:hypothetical protein
MTVQSIQERIPLVAQAIGLALVILYAAGFVVLSVHHASFGISQFNLLRPKILAAGILFCIFIALPIAEAARVFGLLGYPPMFPTPDRTGVEFDKRLYYLPFVRLLAFLLGAIAIGWTVRAFLQEYTLNPRVTLWYVAMLTPTAAVAFTVRYRGKRNPALTAWLCMFALAWIIFCFKRAGDLALTITLSWFFGCALIAYFLDSRIMGAKDLRDTNWANFIGWSIGALTVFALLIYPQIRWSLGGGAPVPVSLRFENKSPLDETGQTRFWMIDETEAGFYVLGKQDAKRAVFLPRSAVRAIYFGEEVPPAEASASLQPEKKPPDKQAAPPPNHPN